jgi:hypothetical protein
LQKKASVFRQLASRFNSQAKDGSVAGRTNKIPFEILQEDTTHLQGEKNHIAGFKTSGGKKRYYF